MAAEIAKMLLLVLDFFSIKQGLNLYLLDSSTFDAATFPTRSIARIE